MTVVRVVDDSPALARLAAHMLRVAGMDVMETVDHFEMLLTPEPWEGVTCVLLDLMLPGQVSGEEILDYLTRQHPHVRRVVLSAVWDPSDRVRGQADALLLKPASIMEITEAVTG